jgi:cytochrome c biogenesis protein CcdA
MIRSIFGLIGLGFVLGLRHGIDWDHIAAITDITGSVLTTEETVPTNMVITHSAMMTVPALPMGVDAVQHEKLREARAGMFLATLYALGHASVVVILGLLAIWAGAILPNWIDPFMERIVGVTLVILGVWIFYSIWRYGRSFRLQSRWMLLFSLAGRAWSRFTSRASGNVARHSHEVSQYGTKTAFGIGLIHGIGAETGSQALLLAGAAGATTPQSGSLMLVAFVVGLVISNSLIALFSTIGFVSSSTKRNVYLAIGVLAGMFSLIVGVFFVTGQGADLPSLEALMNALFGTLGS